MRDFSKDIPYSLALAAHNGTSFVPERRAQSTIDEHVAALRADYESLLTHADTDVKRAVLEREFDRYHAGLVARNRAYLQSRSRIVSTMIAGASNFPARRMNKRGEVVHKRLIELLDFRERALQAILRKLHPERRPIMAGDTDAVERLQANIRQAEREQEFFKQANVIVRRKPKQEITDEKLVDLMELGFSETRARQLFEPDFCGRFGIPGYELTNNGANLRRMKQRLEQIQLTQEQEDRTTECEHATIEDCPAENRVRLFFPGKPAESVRTRLKSCGFRWAPSNGCWQAYRNNRSLAVAREVAGSEQTIEIS